MLDVSVIIVNYNTREITSHCINSIFDYTKGASFEVILVDNGSTDGSRELFSDDNRITYIYSETNLGFGKANNLGAKHAKGNYLFFLNSDTYFENDVLHFFLEYLNNANDIKLGVVGALLRNEKGEINGYGGEFPTLWSSLKTALHLDHHKDFPGLNDKVPFSVEYVLGADMFVSNSLFQEVRGFDESFFMYYEESDLQYRSHILGYKNVIIGGPRIVHLDGGSQHGRLSHQKRMMVEDSHLRFHKKHCSFFAYSLFSVLYFVLRIPTLFRHYSLKENLEYLYLLMKWI